MNTAENVILVDADHVDRVAFNLIVNFERMIGRRIPQADMARWIDCIALDGGVREGDHSTLVALLHDKQKSRLENFLPSDYAELDGKAFRDNLGEFTISALPVEQITTKESFIRDALETMCMQQEVKRVMVVADETVYVDLRQTLRRVDDADKRVTLFSMQPLQSGPYRQEILGFSLMSAMGIRSDEIKTE